MPKNSISNFTCPFLFLIREKERVTDTVNTLKITWDKSNKVAQLCPRMFVGLVQGSVISVDTVWFARFGKWHTVIMMDFSFETLGNSRKGGVRGPKPTSPQRISTPRSLETEGR